MAWIRKFRWEAAVALLSMAIVWLWVALATGIEQMPSNTMDSDGRTMGFNDPLSVEHYGIILRSWSFYYLRGLGYYDWLLLAMNGLGVGIVLSGRAGGKKARYFFLGQLAVFLPGALLGGMLAPYVLMGVMSGGLDRESFTDIPIASLPIQWVWVWAALLVFFFTRWREKEGEGASD